MLCSSYQFVSLMPLLQPLEEALFHSLYLFTCKILLLTSLNGPTAGAHGVNMPSASIFIELTLRTPAQQNLVSFPSFTLQTCCNCVASWTEAVPQEPQVLLGAAIWDLQTPSAPGHHLPSKGDDLRVRCCEGEQYRSGPTT